MRLIHARTRLFETFNDETKLPRYAILSHRWVDGQEIVYKDFLKRRNLQLSGWEKIDRCCVQALKDDIAYVWIDTCCIDKKSSAELSEAINSMYRWYGGSVICYAYLNDVHYNGNSNWEESFVKSKWFTRSWTLQEMLAPEFLRFFDAEWRYIGEKSTLSEELAEASGIHLSALTSQRLDLSDWSVAQRMSWASKREATRIEDVAYSLLGIFDVNMPLLYGEGNKAFRRLQEEIIRASHDHTIFAWSSAHLTSWGLLASSPRAFEKDANVTVHEFQSPKAYALTNLGLSIELPLQLWLPKVYWAGLNVTKNGIDQIGIWLLAGNTGQGLYHKVIIPSKMVRGDEVDEELGCTASRRSTSLKCRYRQLDIPLRGDAHRPIPQLGAFQTGYVQGRLQSSSWQSFASYCLESIEMIDFEAQIHVNAMRAEAWPDGNLMSPNSCFGIFTRVYTQLLHRTISVRYASRAYPCTGVSCDITFPAVSRAVGVLSIGMDSEMRPVLMLAERSHIEEADMPKSFRQVMERWAQRTQTATLVGKNIWQCTGLEDYGWQQPSPEPLVTLPDMAKGLWAFKATEEPVSSFLINLYSLPDRFVNIVVERKRPDRFEYSVFFREGLHQTIDAKEQVEVEPHLRPESEPQKQDKSWFKRLSRT